jgi:transcriptional regulator with XRE-family HTH domain
MKSNIANLRDSLGLTQREVALALGVTETTIANWERGRSGLDWIDRLIRLCRLLECELDDLLDYDEDDDMLEDELSFEELRALYRAGKLTQSSAR